MKKSLIDNDVRFSTKGMTAKEFMRMRRDNKSITYMAWITLKPRYDIYLNEIYDPKTVILIFLN